jgi:hypothetical protein
MLATSRASVKAIAGAGDPRAPMGVEQKVKLQRTIQIVSREQQKALQKAKQCATGKSCQMRFSQMRSPKFPQTGWPDMQSKSQPRHTETQRPQKETSQFQKRTIDVKI